MQLGRFICLEGIEGAGKTTQIKFIADYITRTLNKQVITTREPGGTLLAEAIRNLLLGVRENGEPMMPETELLLLFAARRQHITQVIQPALEKGHWVVCDRFTETSYAYQGGARNIATDFIETLTFYIHQTLKIDRVILLDVPVEVALTRLKERQLKTHVKLDRIEQESYTFFERARKSYLERSEVHEQLYRTVNANLALKDVQSQIQNILDELCLI